MSNIEITLPDGSKQSVAAETRPIDIAKAISPRLADAAIVAKVNGELFDLTRPLEKDGDLPEEDDDNANQDSDDALPDDEEEAAIARHPTREGRFDDIVVRASDRCVVGRV